MFQVLKIMLTQTLQTLAALLCLLLCLGVLVTISLVSQYLTGAEAFEDLALRMQVGVVIGFIALALGISTLLAVWVCHAHTIAKRKGLMK